MIKLILHRKFKTGRIVYPSRADSMSLIDLLMCHLNIDDEYRHSPEVTKLNRIDRLFENHA